VVSRTLGSFAVSLDIIVWSAMPNRHSWVFPFAVITLLFAVVFEKGAKNGQ
jgi:hypothetical protein